MSDIVYPSDEELYEAYINGDIDYQTYQNLVEIFENGIDSTEMYLLDEIPNFGYFIGSRIKDYSIWKVDEAEPFLETGKTTKYSSYLKIRQFQKLEENGEDKNQIYIGGHPSPGWILETRYDGNYQDEYLWSRRSLIYNPSGGAFRKMTLGNYTARYGLGLSVGYRGRLFQKDDLETSESLLFPNYGGFNGLYVEGARKGEGVKMMVNYDRSSAFEFKVGAIDFRRSSRSFTAEGIVLGGGIKNRTTEKEYRYYQLGTFFQYRSRVLISAVEAAYQQKARNAIPAAIWESTYRHDDLTLHLSVWHYADDYLNLTGGGRSGLRYKTITIDSIDFNFSDRRNDQDGILLKAASYIDSLSTLNVSISTYGSDRTERSSQLIFALERRLSAKASGRLYFAEFEQNLPGELKRDRRIRAEYRYSERRFSTRSYIGYRRDKSGNKYLSIFLDNKIRPLNFGAAECWINFDRINFHTGKLDYFYGYIREVFYPAKHVELAAKYSYRYGRSSSSGGESLLLLEAKGMW